MSQRMNLRKGFRDKPVWFLRLSLILLFPFGLIASIFIAIYEGTIDYLNGVDSFWKELYAISEEDRREKQ